VRAEGDVTDDEYFNRVVSGSGIGAVAAPIMGAGTKNWFYPSYLIWQEKSTLAVKVRLRFLTH